MAIIVTPSDARPRARWWVWVIARVRADASGDLEVGCRGLAALHHHLIADLLAFIQTTKTSRLYRCDVDEHVLAAVLRHNEAIAFGRVEPLDCTASHRLRNSPSGASC